MAGLAPAQKHVSMWVIDQYGQEKVIPEGDKIQSVRDERSRIFCQFSSSQSADFEICQWIFRKNQQDSCFVYNPELSNEINNCPIEVKIYEETKCLVDLKRISEEETLDWNCKLDDGSAGLDSAGQTSRAVEVIDVLRTTIKLNNTVFLYPGDKLDIECSVRHTDEIKLEWSIGGKVLENATSTFYCNAPFNCYTTSVLKFRAEVWYDRQDLICTSIREDSFGRFANGKGSSRINIIDNQGPGKNNKLSTVEIVFLVLGLLLLVLLIILLVLCFWCGWCCFNDKENDPHPILQRNQTYPYWTQRINQENNKTYSMHGPLPNQSAQDFTPRAPDYETPPPIPPRRHELSLERNIMRDLIRVDNFQRSPPPHIYAPKPIRPVKKPLPPVPNELLYGNQQDENAARDELMRFGFEGSDRGGLKPGNRADDLSTLETASHLDEIDFDAEFERLGYPFRPLAKIYRKNSLPSDNESSSVQSDLPFESWI